jgi:hypothetical protein
MEKIGQTKTDKWANEALVCRQIVSEISKFGINQNQRLEIIKLLSLELENHEAIVAIAEIIKEVKEISEESKIIV